MALILSYFQQTKKYTEEYGDKTIILMMVGSFYEMYGEKSSKGVISGSKIEEISKICDLAIAQKTGTNVMAGFTYTKIDKYLKKIQDAGYTTIVIKQDPANPKIRSIEGIYSPGTFFNPDACEISNNTMCIWVERASYMKNKSIIVGIANIDIYTGRVILFEYKTEDKHNPTTYDELERYISTYKPSEIIFISNFDKKMSADIMNFAGIFGATPSVSVGNTNACKNIHMVCLEDEILDTAGDNATTTSHIFKEKARKCEKQTYRNEILQKFYKYSVAESIIEYTSEYEYGTQAFIFLLNFLYEHNPNLVNKIREPLFDNKSDRMILANHSLKQLNIIDDNNYTGKYSSVLKFLNNCITPMGMRKFKYKMLNPIFDIEKLNKEYNITEYILQHNNAEIQITEWRKQMAELKDIEKLHRQLVHQKVNPRNLYHFYNNLKIVAELFDGLHYDKTITAYIYDELGLGSDFEYSSKNINRSTNENNISVMCNNIRNFMTSFFDIEKCSNIDNLNFDDNFVLEKVSGKLDDIVYNYENSCIELKTIQSYLDKLISAGEKESKSEKKYEYVKIHDTEKMGYSLVTTKRRSKILEDQLKEQVKKYGRTGTCAHNDVEVDVNQDIEGSASDSRKQIHVNIEYINYKKIKAILPIKISGLTYPVSTGSNNAIVSTQINKICDNIISSKNEMKNEIENIFNDFVKKFQNIFDFQFQKIIDALTIIDNLQNKVYIAIKNKYTRPVIMNSSVDGNSTISAASYVKAKDLRHCLIEHINTNEVYVTNDIELGNGTDQHGILLYGTNAVGKTSLIRALGIAVIMAQAGLYVPCSSFEYIPYKSILTRILGNDNLFKGMSTFMVEMSELRVILKSANNNALILGDELCSGTEMDSAISIFVAGLKKMHDAECSFIFATHMHEINNYEEVTSLNRMTMKHLEVTYNKELDCLVYDRKLKDGSGFSMYGLEVCKSLHLPDDFLDYANNIRLKYRNRSSEQSILSMSPSKYNANKLRTICEMCKKEMGTEIHHLQHQKNADKYDFIDYVHKNHSANLISICEKCHNNIHLSGQQHKKVKTSIGSIIIKK
jgi:DNA mismatch repair protein MutS